MIFDVFFGFSGCSSAILFRGVYFVFLGLLFSVFKVFFGGFLGLFFSPAQSAETPISKGVDKKEQKREQKPINKAFECKNADC